MCGGAAAAAFAGPVPGHFSSFIPLWFGAFVIYIFAAMKALELRSGVSIRWIVIYAIAMRVPWIFATPSLSDDFQRMLWEGRAVVHGVNPYQSSPIDLADFGFRDPAWIDVNHPLLPAIYPPFIQALGAAAWKLSGGSGTSCLIIIKILFVIFDLMVIVPLARWLQIAGRPVTAVILWAWNPLVIIEFAGQAHNDAPAIFFMVLGGWACAGSRPVLSAAALAMCTLSKLAGIAVLPFVILRTGSARAAAAVLVWLLVTGAGYIYFMDAGALLFRSMVEYAIVWEFNSWMYALPGIPPEWLRFAGPAATAVFFGVAWRARSAGHAFFIAVMSLLLFSPALHPWYVTWALPFSMVAGSLSAVAWSAGVFLAYFVLSPAGREAGWRVPDILVALQVAPVAFVLIVEWVRRPRLPPPDWASGANAGGN